MYLYEIHLGKDKHPIILFNAKSDEKYRWYWKSILHSILLFFLSFILLSTIIYIWPVMLTYGPKKAIQYMPHLYNAHYWNSLPSWSCLSNSTFFVAVTNKLTSLLHLRSLTVDQPRMMQLCNVNKTFLCNYQKKVCIKKGGIFCYIVYVINMFLLCTR